jgi:hypothetical protein
VKLAKGRNHDNAPPTAPAATPSLFFPLTALAMAHTRAFVAQVAELVDASASGADARKGVKVRVLSWAPHDTSETSETHKNPLKRRVFCCLEAISGHVRWSTQGFSSLPPFSPAKKRPRRARRFSVHLLPLAGIMRLRQLA